MRVINDSQLFLFVYAYSFLPHKLAPVLHRLLKFSVPTKHRNRLFSSLYF
jgi:hypothetical protein